MKHRKRFLKDQRILLALVILLIVAVVSIINPRFIAVKNLITIFQQISVIGILTMAMSMLLIGGGIDLSIGNIMVLSGVVMARVLGDGGSVMTAVALGVLVGIACGLLNGAVIAKSKCIPLIITLGTSQVFYGLALTISGGRIMSFGGAFNAIGKTRLFDVFPVMLFVLIFMVAVSYVLMNRTRFGRRIVAIGGNEKNAFLSGIHVIKYKVLIYGIAGFFCSVAAIIFSARIDSITANAGAGYETSALTAAIIGGVTFDGGKGTISGAFLGCVLMGVISNAMNILQVETYIQTIITGGIIVSAVVLSNINNMKKK
ncbi:MAG: ABC transporter permease [Lachnospiraceae bacterium]|nr:ABC transporter permease [Lachnospiraceae bacterium]